VVDTVGYEVVGESAMSLEEAFGVAGGIASTGADYWVSS
jgi:hypothetical protein